MDIDKQKNVLTGALSGRSFALRADALGDPTIEGTLRALFSDGWLRMEDADLASGDGTVTLTGRAAVFRVPTATVTATFHLGETPAFTLSATGFPVTWTFAQSFPGSSGSFLDSVVFRDPIIGIDTRAQDALPRDFQFELGLPRNPPALEEYVLRGLTFEADVALGTLDVVSWIVAGERLRVRGPMELKGDSPRFWLRSQQLPPVEMGSFSMPIEVQLVACFKPEAATVETGQAGPASIPVHALARLAATATYRSGGKGEFELPIAAMVDNPAMDEITFEMGTEDLSRMAANALADAIGANDFMKGLDGLLPALDAVTLARVAVGASIRQRRITSLRVDLRMDATIVFAKDLLSLGGFTFRFALVFSSTGAMKLAATTVFDARLLGAACTGSMTLPQMQFSAGLNVGQTIDLGRLVEMLLPEIKKGGPPLECKGLRFYGGLRDGSLSLFVDLAGEWRFSIGAAGLTLQRMILSMARDSVQGKTKSTGFVSGELIFCGVELSARWQVPGGLILKAAIDELNLLETIESLCGKKALDGLPLSLDFLDTKLTNVTIGADFSRNSFNLGATAEKLGRAELFVEKPQGGGWGLGLGIYLGAEVRLSQLHKSLDVLDGFSLKNPYVTLSTFTARQLSLPNQPQQSTAMVQRGLSLYLPATLKPTGALLPLKKILGDDGTTVTLSGALTTDGLRVEAALAGFEVAKGVTFESAGFRIATMAGATSFAVFGRILVKTRDELRFTGDLVTQPTGASLSATMQGTWNKPFGIEGMTLADVALTIGISAAGLPSIGLAGTTKIGSFAGSFALLLNSIDPLASAVVLRFNKLTLGVLFESVISPKVRQGIPNDLLKVIDSGLEDVDVYLVPKSTYIGQNYYAQGFRFKGKTDLLGWRAELDASLAYTSGLKLMGSTEPVRLGRIDDKRWVFELTGSASDLFKDREAKSKGEPQAFEASAGGAAVTPPKEERLPSGARPSKLGGPQVRISLSALEPPSFLLSCRTSLLGVVQDVLAEVDAGGVKLSLVQSTAVSRLTVTCQVGGKGLKASGELDFNLDLSVDLKIPKSKQSLGRIALKARLDGAIAISIDGDAFRLTAEGGFEWQGNKLRVPQVVLTAPMSEVREVIASVARQIQERAYDIFKPVFGKFDDYWNIVEKGALQVGASIGQGAGDLGQALKAGFSDVDADLAGEALKAVGFSPEDTIGTMRGVFGASADDAADFLKDSWGKNADEVKKLLKSAGWSDGDIDKATKATFKTAESATDSTVDAAKSTKKKAKKKLKKIF